jgi:uncharacterized membrane protein YeaQ/YmgE (transglycosylase-associated protein family)
MDLIGIIVQLIAGAVGGAVTGKAVKSVDLGNVGNIIAGIVGGVGLPALAGMIPGLEMLSSFAGAAPAAADAAATTAGGLDIGALLGQGVGGLVGGGVLTAIAGAVKNAMNKG